MNFLYNLLMGKHREDYLAILDRDPAVSSILELFFCYPGLKALRYHRVAHKLYLKGHKVIARMISQIARKKTGIEIHPGAIIGNKVFIDHGSGIVIGETAVIGDDCTIYQGVTLGGTGKDVGKRHPTVGVGVTIGAGAKVLGPINIGDYSKIGAGSIVLKDVPQGSTVVGNPGRIVRNRAMKKLIDLDQCNLPDPILDNICNIKLRLDKIEKSINVKRDISEDNYDHIQ